MDHKIPSSRRYPPLTWLIALLIVGTFFALTHGAISRAQPLPTPTLKYTSTPEPTATHTPAPTPTLAPTSEPDEDEDDDPPPPPTPTPVPVLLPESGGTSALTFGLSILGLFVICYLLVRSLGD